MPRHKAASQMPKRARTDAPLAASPFASVTSALQMGSVASTMEKGFASISCMEAEPGVIAAADAGQEVRDIVAMSQESDVMTVQHGGWKPRGTTDVVSPIEEVLSSYTGVMPGRLRREYYDFLKIGLQALVEHGDGCITMGSACSGSDIAAICLQIFTWHSQDILGVQAKFRHRFICEADEDKRSFLVEQFEPEMVFENVACFSQRTTTNLASGEKVYIPQVGVFSAGFSCKSRSSLNNKSHEHRDCIQRADMTTETGFTYHHVKSYIDKFRPKLVLLENVRQILSQGDFEKSDAEWIADELRKAFYYPQNFVFDATSFGSPAARTRIYILAWRLDFPNLRKPLKLPEPNPMEWCNSFIEKFTIDPVPLGKFLKLAKLDDALDVLEEISTVQVPKGETAQKDTKWRDEHCDAFRDLGLGWPFDIGPPGWSAECLKEYNASAGFPGFAVLRGSMPDRMVELTCFLMLRFPFDPKAPPEFVGVNPSLGRQCPPPYSDSPWRTTIPCLTGQGRIIVRFWDERLKIVLARPTLGVEAFAVIGWDYSFWRKGGTTQLGYSDSLLLNMSGNAFSAFAVLPMAMTLFAGAGILEKVAAATEDCSSEEDEASGDDQSSASS